MSRRGASLAAGALATLAFASSAHAAIPWAPCPSDSKFQCAKVGVPLDPTGATPGTITLTAERLPSTTPSDTALVALAGGPGQAAIPLADDIADEVKAGLATHDLIVFDQRGTGSSDPLKCEALDDATESDVELNGLDDLVSKCANEIGPQRAFFTTAQSVADLEALRVAGGYNKLLLYGVSYGTKVAENYAAAFPNNVAGLVLDSVVPPTGPDSFARTTFAAIPRVLHDLCSNEACRHATPNVVSDFDAEVHHLDAHHGVLGSAFDGRGHRVPVGITGTTLYDLLTAGDLNPAIRALFPAAVRAARNGHNAALFRLTAYSEGLGAGDHFASSSEEADDNDLFLDTTCEELQLPWPRTATTVAARKAAAEAAIAALPSSEFAPFTRDDVLSESPSAACVGWPNATPTPAVPGPLPNVPTLILEGKADLRTTVADAQAVAAQIPDSTLVVDNHIGHSVVGADSSGCAQRALSSFLLGQSPAGCTGTSNQFSPVATPPSSLANEAGSSTIAKTVNAAGDTISDQIRLFILTAIGDATNGSVGGLNGGFSVVVGTHLHLHAVSYVPGMTVTGSVSVLARSGTVTISGSKAPHGKLKFTSGGVTGTLGGHRVDEHTARAASASATWGVTLPRRLPHPLVR